MAAGVLDSEHKKAPQGCRVSGHKKKPRRAAVFPGIKKNPAGLPGFRALRGFVWAIPFFPEYQAGYNQGFRIRTLCI